MLRFHNVAGGHIKGVATLTGFAYKEMKAHLLGQKKLAIITR